ncbi:Cof subfamily protein (haloacid dehalogenase superfamily) [Weissella uvarum]|uniref:Cof-type HAD-IIB family hydrolase n=1 Tax=Weissella uvarum TaxID=1479233 RepID=UPI00195FF7A0|nr:HAD family hydrolase [Weissella uvarum]MBM7617152.1 Cof subfamily protein (haloacid dehalogenase superfamily) [Weissella uvarum]MCM0595448.1 HAD family phosphatase [Weissella uvarum]
MKKLIGIDLDHTTLRDDGKVSNYTKEVLQAVQANGHIVAIITGRSPRISTQIYQEIGLTSPLVNFNGGLVTLPNQDWDGEYSFTFSSEIIVDVILQVERFKIQGMVLENEHGAWGRAQRLALESETALFFPMNMRERRLLTLDNLPETINEALIYIDSNQQADFIDYINQRYGHENVEARAWGAGSPIVSIGVNFVNKYMGLTSLQKAYDIDVDHTYAFGDEMNDYDMLYGAAHGIMMANGNEKLRPIANAVTRKTNNEDGLADYLENVLKLV